MKNKVIVVLIILLLGVVIGASIYILNKNIRENEINNESNISSDNEIVDKNEKDIVIIENGKIQNEELIDEFIEKTIYTNIENQELNIRQDNTNIKVTYTSGEYAKIKSSKKNEEETNIPVGDGSHESNKQIYGYYTLSVNDIVKGEYALGSHTIKRITSDNIVTLYFDAPLIDYATIPEICKYNLESSNYNKKFELSYIQRKDLGIKNIYDTGDYSVKTFGGDVSITIEKDMVYSLEDALNKNVITADDILKQAEMDSKYGICQRGYYSDGGSTEYMYNNNQENYTILKLNTLNNEKDLVIGMSGKIIDLYSKNK